MHKPKTLYQIFQLECDKPIKTVYPCNSCYGCENKLKTIKEWVIKKPTRAMFMEPDGFTIHLISKRELLDELTLPASQSTNPNKTTDSSLPKQ
jgi:hypothetical protein